MSGTLEKFGQLLLVVKGKLPSIYREAQMLMSFARLNQLLQLYMFTALLQYMYNRFTHGLLRSLLKPVLDFPLTTCKY